MGILRISDNEHYLNIGALPEQVGFQKAVNSLGNGVLVIGQEDLVLGASAQALNNVTAANNPHTLNVEDLLDIVSVGDDIYIFRLHHWVGS